MQEVWSQIIHWGLLGAVCMVVGLRFARSRLELAAHLRTLSSDPSLDPKINPLRYNLVLLFAGYLHALTWFDPINKYLRFPFISLLFAASALVCWIKVFRLLLGM
jgi:hypothetical protein